jgi:hypothetical protein
MEMLISETRQLDPGQQTFQETGSCNAGLGVASTHDITSSRSEIIIFILLVST